MNIGVSNVERNANDARYLITHDRNPRLRVATAEVVNGVYGIRDRNDNPVRVGSPLYNAVREAIDDYEDWSARH